MKDILFLVRLFTKPAFRRMPEHPTALLGTPMLRASFGTLIVKDTNNGEMGSLAFERLM